MGGRAEDWKRSCGSPYTGTKGKTPDTDKGDPASHRACPRPYAAHGLPAAARSEDGPELPRPFGHSPKNPLLILQRHARSSRRQGNCKYDRESKAMYPFDATVA